MDGVQGRLTVRRRDSVQFKLSVALTAAILCVAVAAGVFSFRSAFDEAHELQDDVLRQVAQLMDWQHLAVPPPDVDVRPSKHREDSRVIVQCLGVPHPTALGIDDGGPLPLPPTLADGLHTLTVNGEAFRVLVRTTAAGERIAVAQESDLRDEIARDGARRAVMPLLLLVPILLLTVAHLVRTTFKPIAALSREIDQRSEQALHPVADTALPAEVRPFVVALNRLLGKVGQSMEAQRRFVADAAHELRSPLTALSLQAERLADADLSADATHRLAVLRQGIERGRALLDQLLALARAQSVTEPPRAWLSVQQLYRQTLEDLMPLAEAKHLDIGVEGEQDVSVWAHAPDLLALVRNLVDNAIRYTPPGGRVDLSAWPEDAAVALCIRDTGPGIPEHERERVFAPFHRVLGSGQIGSGLGLSIVKAIAERLGATVELSHADETRRSGLCVRVRIPVPAGPRTGEMTDLSSS